jgi:hypothetical protein
MSRPPIAKLKVVPQPAHRRLIVTLPVALHRKIKISCAARNIPMAQAVRDVLERAPWPIEDH